MKDQENTQAERPKRKRLTLEQRERVKDKTGGRCHVCGCNLADKWQADHVRPKKRGGECVEDNFLPACLMCNRLKWAYPSKKFRRIIQIGVFMYREIQDGTELGKLVQKRVRERKRLAAKRRKPT